MQRAIGGYFGLELRDGVHYHEDALRLNTARNCFEYILRVHKYRKVYIPYYTCEVMLEPLKKCGVLYEFYHIDLNWEPIKVYRLRPDEAFLYTNYYGLRQACVQRLAELYGSQLIVDNAQAFYAPRVSGCDTFYSARKFFGVPDGSYLYIHDVQNMILEQDISFDRMSHLLKRIDFSAEEGYADFQKNDEKLIDNPIRSMSSITEYILSAVDYDVVKQKRLANFRYLHAALGQDNPLKYSALMDGDVPMVYPFYTRNSELRKKLIKNRVFVATYWMNVKNWCQIDDWEYQLAENIIPLPIDQRYGFDEMNIILEIINN